MCVVGAKKLDLCMHGDQRIAEATSKQYRKDKEMKKGNDCWAVNERAVE